MKNKLKGTVLEGTPIILLIILFIVVVGLLIAFQGLIVYAVWNFLILYLIPTLPVLSFAKSCVAGVVLSVIGSFFKSSK